MRRSALLRYVLFVTAFLTVSGFGSRPVALAAESVSPNAGYLEAADKICLATNTRLIAAVAGYETHEVAKAKGAGSSKTKVAKPEQVAEFLSKVAFKEVTEELRLLRFLKAPATDATKIDSMLTKAEQALAKAKKDPKAVAHNDPFSKVAKEFAAYGFAVCGRKIDRPQP